MTLFYYGEKLTHYLFIFKKIFRVEIEVVRGTHEFDDFLEKMLKYFSKFYPFIEKEMPSIIKLIGEDSFHCLAFLMEMISYRKERSLLIQTSVIISLVLVI